VFLLKKERISDLHPEEQTVYIYQMGKVGSISLLKTIEKLGIQAVHEHNLTLSHSDALGVRRMPGVWGG